jgi:nitroreductase
MQLEKAIKTRKSVRKYLSKKPDWRKIIRALDFATYAPAAGNQFVIKIILVKQKEKIQELAKACQQDFVKDAHYVVVFISDVNKLKRSYDKRAEKYSRQQAGAAIENFLLALNEQGLVTCWIGYFVDNQVKRVLKIPDGFEVEALFPVGKETKSFTRQKAKPDLDNLIFFDEFGNRYMKPKTRLKISSS